MEDIIPKIATTLLCLGGIGWLINIIHLIWGG